MTVKEVSETLLERIRHIPFNEDTRGEVVDAVAEFLNDWASIADKVGYERGYEDGYTAGREEELTKESNAAWTRGYWVGYVDGQSDAK